MSPSPYINDPLNGESVAPFDNPRYSQINLYNWYRANFATIDKNAAAAYKTVAGDWAVGFIHQADILKTTDIATILKAYRIAPTPQNNHKITLNSDYTISLGDGPPVADQIQPPDPTKWEIGPDPANFQHSILVPISPNAVDVQVTQGTSMLGAEVLLGTKPGDLVATAVAVLKALKAQGMDVKSLAGMI